MPRTSKDRGFPFPSFPKFSAPDLPKPSVPDMSKFSAPDLPKPSVPDMSKFSAPDLPKFSAPDLPKFSAPDLPKFSAPDLPKFSAPDLPKFSAPDGSQQQGFLESNKTSSPAQEQFPAPQQTFPFKAKDPTSFSNSMKKSESSQEIPSRIVEGKEPQLPQVQPREPSSPPSDSVLDLMKKKYSSESSKVLPIPQPSKPSSGAEQSSTPPSSLTKLQPAPSDERRKEALRSNRANKRIEAKNLKKRGPLPLWLAQFLMLVIFGGCIYSLTSLYSSTNKILTGTYKTVDRFLLGLRFSYDRTDKKDATGS